MNNNKYFAAILFILLFSTTNIHSQEFKYKKVPALYTKSYLKSNNFQNEVKKLKVKSYNLVNSLPKNCDKLGKTDYTDIIQSVIDKYRVVVFPNFPLLINPKGLNVSSDSKLIFNKKSKLILQANDIPNYEILKLHNVKNVVLYFPAIIGDRDNHIGTKGEWGMGISIRSSQDIKIYKPFIMNCWGDGIYLGTNGAINKDIFIYNAYLDNNRRNGISVVSAINLNIKNPLIANTNGTSPMSGIDFEPNKNSEELQNITITNPITYNNAARGILFAFGNLYGVNKKNIIIDIKNHIDDGSAYAIGFHMDRLKNDSTSSQIDGAINMYNPVWKNSIKDPIQLDEISNNSINVNFTKLKIVKNGIFDTATLEGIKQKYKKGNLLFK